MGLQLKKAMEQKEKILKVMDKLKLTWEEAEDYCNNLEFNIPEENQGEHNERAKTS